MELFFSKNDGTVLKQKPRFRGAFVDNVYIFYQRVVTPGLRCALVR